MNNSGIILSLAYPETIVKLATEWYSPLLRFIGLGKKGYIRAGHAALLLINKKTGAYDYHDFGRYITTWPNGRVRSKDTDYELDFSLKIKMVNGEIRNLKEVLHFLATNPKLTHGEGKLVASVCDEIDYSKAKAFISELKEAYFIRYGAFLKSATNCSRFVTDTIIASTTNKKIKKRLTITNRFTPSTVANPILADTKGMVYEVSPEGSFSEFKSTIKGENLKYFRDPLKEHSPNYKGNLEPKPVEGLCKNAQWLGGIGAGAWFELHRTDIKNEYRYRRISAIGVDVDAIFKVEDETFDYDSEYQFDHYSNCNICHIRQNGNLYKFSFVKRFSLAPLERSI
ncbi:hypothetical protein D7030_11915 [Flavobacteriaceae bacterium AU392]|nr:hypothetical protein D1817_12755 [Flavobacteriaceae bacterium]RKM82857.1 hypothetical protein D7030_11915 [Flavobacteriaceae bacterium AU392]